ncbi:MAG: polyprenyl synthetase family protein [Bacteroidota bacterium]|nr:polyprenyl synthetase family protein [Bacteroidota bacterium]MDP4236982.1 polyprenyl synthetase family protein [Bacteroidota bacterium]
MKNTQEFLKSTEKARKEIELRLLELIPESPRSLYDPIRLTIQSGGKRLRPVLTYLSSLSNPSANWLPAACAVELLHTFTLVHDDIMDNADTRRGNPTLHTKYDINTAILAGDAIIALAEESLSSGGYELAGEMSKEFAFGFRCVCEGQAYDKEFELRNDVTTKEYFRMIDLKSAKMLELAATLGTCSAGGEYVEVVREFAHHTGIAFQIRDDLLDLIADEASFGKKIGGDVLEGKRTFLFLSAMEMFDVIDEHDQEMLLRIRDRKATSHDIAHAKKSFAKHGIIDKAMKAIEEETITARNSISGIGSEALRIGLDRFSDYLLGRTY